MPIYRLKINITSPWRTPWQADTIIGLLLTTCARSHGANVLNEKFIEPMLAGAPPFVISDAFAGNLLPAPLWLRLADWGVDVDRKKIKKMSWLDIDSFNIARCGDIPKLENFRSDNQIFLNTAQPHNTLSRLSETTGDHGSGLAPFSEEQTALLPQENQEQVLTVYIKFLDDNITDLVIDLFNELSLSGFGADIGTGKGQFEFIDNLQPEVKLNNLNIEKPNGVVSLSTFQPATNAPTSGYWQSFAKMAKAGPGLGLEDVRKNTLVMLRPGACFAADSQAEFLGRAVPMQELLPEQSVSLLQQKQINLIHPAFALTLPVKFDYCENNDETKSSI